MNLKFWKHATKKEVIKQECYNKLPPAKRSNYIGTNDSPTHIISDDSFFTSVIIADEISNIISAVLDDDNDNSSYDNGNSNDDNGSNSCDDSGSSSSDDY